jgi:hypothetical protein
MHNIFDASGEGVIDSVGVTVHEMRQVARRQFMGSIVAGIVVVSVASLVALRPSPPEMALRSTRTISLLRHPDVAAAPRRDLAATDIEHSERP